IGLMAKLRISMFGGLALESDAGNLPQIPSRTGRSLFAYLVTHRDTAPTRDLLAGLFWPEMAETQARRRLSHALWQIQNVLTELGGIDNHVIASPTSVRFNPEADYWLDVEQFDGALAELKSAGHSSLDAAADGLNQLTAAIELYRGDFLAGFYDDWIVLEQERLRQGLFSALNHIIRLNKSRGDFDQALLYARRLAMQDTLREEAHREVMRLSYLLGRPNEALQQYERLGSILASELGTGPDAETTALRNDIASGRESSIIPFSQAARSRLFEASDHIPLVGRVPERSEITARLERALSGSGGLAVVEGDAGIGKTRLLVECAEDANWRGLTVLWGNFPADGPTRPFAGLVEALADGLTPLRVQQLAERVEGVWLRALTPLIPGLDDWVATLPEDIPLKPEEERARVQQAFYRTFRALAELTPTMLVLDNIHQADEDSFWALRSTIRRLDDFPLVVCLAYRREEMEARPALWSLLRSLGEGISSNVIRLGQLSSQETAEYVRRVMPDGPKPELSRRLQEETGGNPLFILETLRALHEHQVEEALKEHESAAFEIEDFPISETVSRLLSMRLDRLSGNARHAVNVLAVAGGSRDIDFLASVSDLGRPELLDALGVLISAGMVDASAGGYSLTHDQLGRVASGDLPDSEKRYLHERVGLGLESHEPKDIESLAYHFSAAGSSRAATYLEIAGRLAVEVRAYATAAAHYSKALQEAEKADWEEDQLTRLCLDYEEVLDVLGDREGQTRLLDQLEVHTSGDPGKTAEVLERQGWLAAHSSRFTIATAKAEAARTLNQQLGLEQGLARNLHLLGTLETWSGRPETALPLLSEAIRLASGNPGSEAECRHALSDALTECHRYAEARAEIDTAIEIYGEIRDLRGLAGALGSSANIQGESGSLDQAVSNYQQAIQLCRSIGYSYGEGRNQVNLGAAENLRGRPAAALAAFESARDIFMVLGNRRGEAHARANLASLLHHLLGDDQAAERESRAALAIFAELVHPRGQAQCLGTLAQIALRRSQAEVVEKTIEQARVLLVGTDAEFLGLQSLRTLAHLRIDQGRKEDALEIIDGAIKRCLDLGITGVLPTLRVTQARALFELGDLDACLASSDQVDSTDEATALLYWRWQAQLAMSDAAAAYETLVEANRRLSARLEGLSDSDGELALRAVPIQRQLSEAWQQAKPRHLTVRLAAADAPTGRATRADEMVDVTWTVEHALDLHLPAGPERRGRQLLRLIQESSAHYARPAIRELAIALEVSPATIRRDLATLRAAGHEVRTRGSR
ncbi:MAG: BTAD domain-containing putative transcriptional regulator, partial [Acidimicrobiia bacterium]